jgi:hypothetical protein
MKRRNRRQKDSKLVNKITGLESEAARWKNEYHGACVENAQLKVIIQERDQAKQELLNTYRAEVRNLKLIIGGTLKDNPFVDKFDRHIQPPPMWSHPIITE